MACEAFEDLLTGYRELSAVERAAVDAHLATCRNCSEFLETLTALDQALTDLYSAAEPRRVFDTACVRDPSPIPEVLDFVGWAAVAAIVIILGLVVAMRIGSMLPQPVSHWNF